MDQESRHNGFNRLRFMEISLGTLATSQLVPSEAEAGLVLERPIEIAQSEAPRLFSSLKQIDAGVLNVGYVEAGPVDGPAAILLHGWPYDIHSFGEVTPRLASAGFRVIVPYARSFGSTNFLSNGTPRTGQPSALVVDTIALMDALNIRQATVAGFDWGARTPDIVAALWPERVRGVVSVSGYRIGSQEAGKTPLPPKAELQWRYQYYFATERGHEGYHKYRCEFVESIWKLASPKWTFEDATFARSAAAFDSSDHLDIVIHNYRWRLGLAQGDPPSR
jgi:pimeloyl-ACP methyl ester carboxylesterase